MQAQILSDKLTVIKNVRQKTYLGYSNSVFVFRDHNLALNVHQFIEKSKRWTRTMRDEDTVNRYVITRCDEQMDYNGLEVVAEEKHKLMSALATFDMNVVIVDITHPLRSDCNGIELICSHQATPYNPSLRIKQVGLNKLLQLNTILEWQKQARDMEQVVKDLDDIIDDLEKYNNDEHPK